MLDTNPGFQMLSLVMVTPAPQETGSACPKSAMSKSLTVCTGLEVMLEKGLTLPGCLCPQRQRTYTKHVQQSNRKMGLGR